MYLANKLDLENKSPLLNFLIPKPEKKTFSSEKNM